MKHTLLNNLGSKHSLLIKSGQFVVFQKKLSTNSMENDAGN